jgi:hypothetical protein
MLKRNSMNWIDKVNERIEKSRLSKIEAGITEKVIKRKQIGFESGLANKGRTHSEETKKVWSELKIGHKRSKASVKKSINGTKETKWLQLLQNYPENILKNAIKKYGNHQNNICDELKCGIQTIRKLCKHYGIEVPKKSNYEKSKFARTKQSESILVWKCSKRKPYRKIGKPKEYYSVQFCCSSFEPKLHKANMLRNMKNGTPYRNMFFEKK